MGNFFKTNGPPVNSLLTSELYDEKTFYSQFISDLNNCTSEVIIESPFITSGRMKILFPVLANLAIKGVKIYIITRNPMEQDGKYALESELEIQRFENSGIQVLLCDGNHHRKLAILDRLILYEGSLNILSQTKSLEIMRRIQNKQLTMKMFCFLNFDKIF